MQGVVCEVVVAHRDRLCRFGFELLQFIFSSNHTTLTVEDSTSTSPESELVQDVLAIIQVFSCRQQGKRRYRNKEEGQQTEADAKEPARKGKRTKVGASGTIATSTQDTDNTFRER